MEAAGGNVEHPLTGPDTGQCNRERLPGTVQPERHQVVHQVITVGDAVEYLRHAGGLVPRRDSLKAEIGFF